MDCFIIRKTAKCLRHPSIVFNKFWGDTKWYQRLCQHVLCYKIKRFRTIRKIRRENKATVVFFAANVSMWRYQRLYEKLVSDKRFDVHVVISPFVTFTKEANDEQVARLCQFFKENNVDYVTQQEISSKGGVMGLKPDILFYTQPYRDILGGDACYTNFKDKLLAYYPYGLQNVKSQWGYNTEFHNIAWRLYYPTLLHKKNAEELSAVKGKNVVVVGEPHADDYLSNENSDPWKDRQQKIRIIWAPHFQIIPNGMFYRPSFLWTYDLMLEIAVKYRDRICMAFKPHPRLYPTLCDYPTWGKERTEEYYSKWKEMDNTQFEDGDFIDLFLTSDAIIHDCGSFTAEYQYTKKPCMFLTKDYNSVAEELCSFGKHCLDNHYVGQCREDVIRFIEEVLILGKDPKKNQREAFFKEYLYPPHCKSTVQNTYDDLVNSLFPNS